MTYSIDPVMGKHTVHLRVEGQGRSNMPVYVVYVSGVTANSNNIQTGGGQTLTVLTKHLQQAVIYNKAQFA